MHGIEGGGHGGGNTFSYKKFFKYLEVKKEKETLDAVLEILAEEPNKQDFFLNNLLPSLEKARIIWKSQGDFKKNYRSALNFLISKWKDRFRNSLGEFNIDPEVYLKSILNKYSAFMDQERKEQEKQLQQNLLETLQGELNQEHSPHFSLQQKELDELKMNSSHLSQNTKKILSEL